MNKVYGILLTIMMVCVGCQWQLRPSDGEADIRHVSIQRYDRIESLYLTTGDFSALQQMNTYFPMQTRMLIEDVLHLGQVSDTDINTKFLYFFQDSTLQRMLSDVQQQYSDMTDINEELADAFERLHGTLGISLDKYLGEDYPFYLKNYTEEQRRMMTRSMIVPDCLSFFILSQYPLSAKLQTSQHSRDLHMGKIQWIVNQLTKRDVFENSFVSVIAEYMKENSSTTIKQLLEGDGRIW